MSASSSVNSSSNISGSNGLKDVVFVQSLDEIEHVGAHHFPACPIASADLVGDLWLVVSPLHQLEDFGPYDIQAKHLAVMDVEENSSVHRLCSPNCVGYLEHCCGTPAGIGLIASGAEDCRTRRERKPEAGLIVRIGAASGRKLL